MNKGSIIKKVYFYLVSIITLMTIVFSLGALIKIGLNSTLFTEADEYELASPPPELYLLTTKGEILEDSLYTCESGCDFTEEQRSQTSEWQSEYQYWLDNKNAVASKQRQIVTSLSLLLIALPLYFIHFISVQRNAKKTAAEEKTKEVIRPVYFYIASLVGLVMIIIFGSMLINLILKSYIFTQANDTDGRQLSRGVSTISSTATESVTNCATACNFNDQTVEFASRYAQDWADWETADLTSGQRQSQASNNIAFLLVAIPLFWYHWSSVRRESRESKD